jgi:hypothetical protein
MPCFLLHVIEQPDNDAYADPDVKDVVGSLPRFTCAGFQPVHPLLASQAVRCLSREGPCWNPEWSHLRG